MAEDCWEPREWQRSFLGYRERFVDDCVVSLRGGKTTLRILQAPSASSALKRVAKGKLNKAADPALTGTTVWDGALVLSHFLTETDVLSAHTFAPLPAMQPPPAAQPPLSCPPTATTSCTTSSSHELHQLAAPSPGSTPTGGAHVSPGSTAAPPPPLLPTGTQAPVPTHHASLQLRPPQLRPPQPRPPQLQPPQPRPPQLQAPGPVPPPLPPPPPRRLPSCIEVGAGTGTVALSLLACGLVRHATITDLADVTPHIRANVGHNARAINPHCVSVCPLQWGSAADLAALQPHGPPFDLVVGSDLIYYSYSEETPHSALLVGTLRALCVPRSVAYLALGLQHNPEEVQRFLGRAGEWFAVERVQALVPGEWRIHDTLVVRLTLRGDEVAGGGGGEA